jgi:transcriptional regulator with XRE-family HTH domain
MDERDRRQALADFLRKRRASISPADVGLAPGMRRRTPGLRREEVAQLSHIGASWYIWLEQGRDVHPSTQVLESLAQALKLSVNERRHLFLLAGQNVPPYGSPSAESLSPALEQVVRDLDPSPACILGRRWDYLTWNRSADAVFALSTAASTYYPHNLIWQLFTSPARTASPHWEPIARSMLAEFRATCARYLGDPWFDELIADLQRVSPDFCRLWPQHDTHRQLDFHKVLDHPILGRLEFEHINLQVMSDPDIRMMIYAPEPATRSRLEEFLAADSAPSRLSHRSYQRE